MARPACASTARMSSSRWVTCPIAHPLVTAAGVTRRRWPGARSVEVAAVPASGERAVIISGAPGSREAVAQIGADSVLSAGRGTGMAALRGHGYLTQHAAGRDWRVGAASFWQVHPGAADTLTAAVLDGLRPQPGDVALDLYCGAGLFAGVLADAVGPSGTVIAVEQDAGAVRDARHNLRGTPWARVHKGDAAAVLGRAGAVRRDPRGTGPAADGRGPAGHRRAVRAGRGGERTRACAGSRTCPAIRRHWPATYPFWVNRDGCSRRCVPLTPSR